MEKKSFLPIGSLVRLKGGKRKLLIVGIHQRGSNDLVYDYSACLYPFGYINADQMFLFNEKNIEEIISTGYSDEELKEYYDDVIWSIERDNSNEDINKNENENTENK